MSFFSYRYTLKSANSLYSHLLLRKCRWEHHHQQLQLQLQQQYSDSNYQHRRVPVDADNGDYSTNQRNLNRRRASQEYSEQDQNHLNHDYSHVQEDDCIGSYDNNGYPKSYSSRRNLNDLNTHHNNNQDMDISSPNSSGTSKLKLKLKLPPIYYVNNDSVEPIPANKLAALMKDVNIVFGDCFSLDGDGDNKDNKDEGDLSLIMTSNTAGKKNNEKTITLSASVTVTREQQTVPGSVDLIHRPLDSMV
jgi:hypothetical protein